MGGELRCGEARYGSEIWRDEARLGEGMRGPTYLPYYLPTYLPTNLHHTHTLVFGHYLAYLFWYPLYSFLCKLKPQSAPFRYVPARFGKL